MRRTLSQLLFVFIICGSQYTSAAPPKFNPEKLAAIKPAMQKFVDDGTVCGAVVAVGTADGTVYTEAVGKQTLESDKPMANDAIFRIMSMTKPVTAMGIMLLAEEGKLSIEDPVEKYLPAFQGQKVIDSIDLLASKVSVRKSPRPITLRDLLTHTSGQLEYPQGLADLGRKRDFTLDEAVCIASQRPLEFDPGTKWKYSSTGIDVLGRIIEVVSGQSYEDFVTERFFKPLRMHDTGFYLSTNQVKRLAEVCGQQDGKLAAADGLPKSMIAVATEKPKFPWPAAGLYSTAADLGRLYQALLRGGELDGHRIISEKSFHEMTQNQTGDLKAGFTPGMCYGLGFGVVREPQGVTAMQSPGTYGHGGAYGTQGWIDPVKGEFLILLIGRVGMGNGDASDIRKEFQTLAVEAIEN